MGAKIFHRVWNHELSEVEVQRWAWVRPWAILTMVVYVVGEVAVLAPTTVIGIGAYLDLREAGFPAIASYGVTAKIFPWLFPVLLLANIIFRVAIGLDGYFIRDRLQGDRGRFLRNLVLYNPVALGTLAMHVLVAALVGVMLLAFEVNFQDGFAFMMSAGGIAKEWIQAHIPALFRVPYKWMAIVLAGTLFTFAAYFEHWISHRSRFLWHVVHAPHHLPDYLHPLGAPLAFSFDFFFIPLRIVVGGGLTQLIYAEPLLMESALVALVWYAFEIFNHSSVHYEWVAGQRLMRWITMLGGGHGAYHYLHHSSAERHQMVNLGAGFLMMWDRIFGTFEEPPHERPPVGWTGNPDIHHNHLRVLFGGLARIMFELRHNPGLLVKLRILFGSVHWNPPITIDYLKRKPMMPPCTPVS